jgi:hypothetical protein
MTNTLAYYDTKFITVVIRFIVQHPGPILKNCKTSFITFYITVVTAHFLLIVNKLEGIRGKLYTAINVIVLHGIL